RCRERHGSPAGNRLGCSQWQRKCGIPTMDVREQFNDPKPMVIRAVGRRGSAIQLALVPNFAKVRQMFDSFDLKLLNALQKNADRTAEALAEIVVLSPSA